MEQIEPSEAAVRFDIDGQALCLDFANTADWHASAHPVEMLNTYSDLVEFGAQAGMLAPEEASRLREQANQLPSKAEHWLAEAITLREAIYRILTAASAAQPPLPEDLGILTRFWRQAAQSMVITGNGTAGIHWGWEFRPDDLGQMLWPVVKSAVELLESDQRERIGQCEDDRGCGYLFIDTSRNRSRRWCSMESCGNRAKAIRHYARAKK